MSIKGESVMKLGYAIPNNQGVAGVADLVDLAREAEHLGYHSAWVSEHLFNTAYVAKRLGNRPYHEALTVLTAIGGATEKIHLGTSVLVLPWHHPVRLAKMIATLDQLSGGRVILGVGVGITREEYDALGVSFSERGAIANECLAAMKVLWSQELPAYSGKYYQFSDQLFSPKAHNPEGPPIWVGGNSPAAQRRLVAHGSGWHPLALSPTQVAEALPGVREQLVTAGRSAEIPVALRTTLEVTEQAWSRPPQQRRTLRGTIPELVTMMRAYHEAGVTHLIIDPNSGDVAYNREILHRIAKEVLPQLSG